MNRHALDVIELPRVLELVAGFASGPAGADRVRALVPSVDADLIRSEHARVAAVRALVALEGGWSPEPVPDLGSALVRLRVAGAPWSAVELLGGRMLVRSSRRTAETVEAERVPPMVRGVLRPITDRLLRAPEIEKIIERAIGDDGVVRDEASPALASIRRERRAADAQLMKVLQQAVAGLSESHRVDDMSITVRNGRYVIPVRREGRGAVGGIVHGASSTGATLFVEPPAALEIGNRMRELEAEEQEEVERILLELTEHFRPKREELVASHEALVVLDALYARARFAIAYQCAPVEHGPAHGAMRIVGGRHPLLIAGGIDVVPFDLELDAGERTLIVSGPNTGGKTVLMKAVGLLIAMTQSGIPTPVSAGTMLPIVDDIFADIGDEQSIEASLSTFSAHLKNLAEILRSATPDSLALIDELGSGTDPLEGAALGGAILETLTLRGVLTLASTHLGALKGLATETAGVVNASLQFDAEALAPTYRLIKGIPGRSYGLGIARRLGLDPDVLERAERRIPTAERDVAALLTDLERKKEELEATERELGVMSESAREKSQRLAARERTLREREKAVERRERGDARRYVLDARQEVEKVIRELRETAAAGTTDDAARDARRALERMAAEHARSTPGESDAPAADIDDADSSGVRPGDYVRVASLPGRVARVLELRDDAAVVTVGAMKLNVPLDGVSRTDAPPEVGAVAVSRDLPDVEVKTEVDLRGMRVDEAETVVLTAVDAAIRADLKQLRIIHGKGTGALRDRVTEMLRKDTRIRGHRLGAWNEGGAGVTVAEFA